MAISKKKNLIGVKKITVKGIKGDDGKNSSPEEVANSLLANPDFIEKTKGEKGEEGKGTFNINEVDMKPTEQLLESIDSKLDIMPLEKILKEIRDKKELEAPMGMKLLTRTGDIWDITDFKKLLEKFSRYGVPNLTVNGSSAITDENPVPVTGTIVVTPSGIQDVNIVSSITLTVQATDLDIRDLTPNQDGVLMYGSDDGGTTKRIIKTDAGGAIQVDLEVASVTVTNGAGAAAVNIQDGGNSLTVDSTDFDIRDLSQNQDSVLIYGSDDGGTTKRVIKTDSGGAIQVDLEVANVTVINGAGASAVNIQDGGNSITVDALDLDIRNLVFATDKVDVSGSTISVTQGTSPWIVSATDFDIRDLAFATDKVDVSGSSVSVSNFPAIQAVSQSGVWSVGRTWTLGSGTDSVTCVQGTSPWVISGTVTATPTGTQDVNIVSSVPLALDATTLAALELVGIKGADGTGIVSNANPLPISDAGGSITIDGTVAVSNLPTTVDTNYGAVGASTIRSAAQIGNATGAALFGAGTTTAQVLRVVLPTDQTAIPVTQSTSPWVVAGQAADGDPIGTVKPVLMAGQDGTNIQSARTDTTGNMGFYFKSTVGAAFADGATNTPVINLNEAGTSTIVTKNYPYMFNGTDWDRTRGTVANGLLVDVSRIVPGTAATNLGKAEDAAHASGDVGIMALGVRNDTQAAFSGTDGDYTPFAVDSAGRQINAPIAGTWANGAQTAVAGSAVQILAANANRKKAIIQNLGVANMIVGITGVTATTGTRVAPGATLILEMPYCETNAIFAIREGAISTTAFAQETT